jgi:pimeloyl-ACP methyl ester carboxylesterase
LVKLGESEWGSFPGAVNETHTRVTLHDGYTVGDDVIYLWEQGSSERKLLYGIPIESRQPGQQVPLPAFFSPYFTPNDRGILLGTALFQDTLGLGYLDLSDPSELKSVDIRGIAHHGVGEFEHLEHLKDNRYLLRYNIDGASWLYEAEFDEANLQMNINHIICGMGQISEGVLEALTYDADNDRFILTFSTAISPTQIYTVEGANREIVFRHTNERILGIPSEWLSSGEDASFYSFDDTRVSARLYLPAPALNFIGPRPVVYYIHGGPQGQERPDFAWFSMPLIQYLTLNGFAVFVPNVRGSTGYGLSYTKQVDRDWGGKDRLDHVHAMTKVLPLDSRLDVKRSAVVGRSYGGYMTLTMAGRHPELWSAAVDMFGPYDLVTFSERIPETWKPYFKVAIGDPSFEEDRKHLVEMSASTYLHQIDCPLLVIQGRNDPRVVERESRDVVETLRAAGKDVDILVFENEGHDVLKFENRVICYNTITDYFKKHLMNSN